VARALGRWADKSTGGSIFPGMARLEHETHYERKAISRALVELEAKGWIMRVKLGRRGSNSVYTLLFKATLSPADNETESPVIAVEGDGESRTSGTESLTTIGIPTAAAAEAGAAGAGL
jgi:hypothetical protein